MAVLVLAVAVVCAPLLALFLDAPLLANAGMIALVLVLGALGFAIVGSVFAATLLKIRSRDVLLPVILYPLLVRAVRRGHEDDRRAGLRAPGLRDRLVLDPVPRNPDDAAFLVLSLCGCSNPWSSNEEKLAVPIFVALASVGFVVALLADLRRGAAPGLHGRVAWLELVLQPEDLLFPRRARVHAVHGGVRVGRVVGDVPAHAQSEVGRHRELRDRGRRWRSARSCSSPGRSGRRPRGTCGGTGSRG